MTWAQLSKTIGELFTLPEKWVLKYIDDEGDEICVSSDRELSEALRLLKTLKTPTLRFNIYPVKEKKNKNKQEKKEGKAENNNNGQPASVVDLINQIAKQFPFLEVSVETDNAPRRCPWRNDNGNTHRAICDNCSVKIPFPGSRFKCNTCPDFDLCEKCKTLGNVHTEHTFAEIKDPRSPVHPAFCDGCNNIIVGDRFKCNTCPDFDLCQACKDKPQAHTDGHEFTKIARPCGRWMRCPRNNIEAPKQEETKKEEPPVVQEPKKEEAKLIPLIPLMAPIPPVVEQPKPAEAPKQEEVKKEEAPKVEEKKEELKKDPFTMKLDQLEEMGFKDRAHNVNLMMKHRGDLVAVVKELLF